MVKRECHAEDQEMHLDKTNNSLRKRWTFSDATGTTGFPTIPRRNDVWETSAPGQLWVVLLIGRVAWEICLNQSEVLSRSGWWSVRHQYGISVLISHTSFRGKPQVGVAKCWLFSYARQTKEAIKLKDVSPLFVCPSVLLPLHRGVFVPSDWR